MNEVSIIINGVRYDAVGGYTHCIDCDLKDKCDLLQDTLDVYLFPLCVYELPSKIFKKSDKKFER